MDVGRCFYLFIYYRKTLYVHLLAVVVMVVEFRRGYLYPEWDVQTFVFYVWGRALVMLLAKRQSVGVVEYRIHIELVHKVPNLRGTYMW